METQAKDRVKKNTPHEKNTEIDKLTRNNISHMSRVSSSKLDEHIKQLDRKWDMERTLELNMASLALTGILMSVLLNRKWLILSSVFLGFFIQHALQGWCPPLIAFRTMKVRTRSEIDEEKYALKALRGDFQKVNNAKEAFKAVKLK